MSFLQVASWNIEHLSGASREDKKQSAYALADHIELAGVDIIALQEVYVTHEEGGVRRNEELDRVCELLEEHLSDPWHYEILPNRNAGDKSQLCTVMWNGARVEKTGMMALDVDHRDSDDWLWDRKPHVVKFSTRIAVWQKDADGNWHRQEEGRSVSVIPLHMKSNYSGSTKNRRVRAKEAETLCAQLDRVRNELDPSLILIGDTNVLEATEPAIETFVDNRLVDLNNNDSATY